MRDLMAMAERPEVISLAGGFPYTQGVDPEEFRRVANELSRSDLDRVLQYGPTEGLHALREQVVAIMAAEGIHARPENVVITAGGQQALDLVFQSLLDPGDAVAVEAPTYPGAIPALAPCRPRIIPIPLDEQGMRTEDLARMFAQSAEGDRPRVIYTIPTFHNPAGVVMSDDRREELLALAEQYDAVVVEDNPYGLLRYQGQPHMPLRARNAERVVYIGTFSKILAPGLRVGWVCAPDHLLTAVNQLKQGADLCTSTLSQRFVLAYLAAVDWRAHVASVNDVYRGRRDALMEALERSLPGRLEWSRPEGGLFLWARLRGMNTTTLLPRALASGVAFVPGAAAFPVGGGEEWMRLNFSGLAEDQLAEGARRLGRALGARD